MFGIDSHQHKAREEVEKSPHKAHLSHEVIGAAAAYEAAKAYQEHQKKNGKPTSHEKAKEIFAGLTAAAVTHLVETKGLNAWDKHKEAQKAANDHAADYLSKDTY